MSRKCAHHHTLLLTYSSSETVHTKATFSQPIIVATIIMKGAPWMALVEAFLVKKLLESQAFHKAVGKAHKRVHQIRHGIPPEEMGGTKLDAPEGRGFLGHFVDELKGQTGRSPQQTQQILAKRTTNSPPTSTRPSQPQSSYRGPEPNAQGANHNCELWPLA